MFLNNSNNNTRLYLINVRRRESIDEYYSSESY
jgi:hypothetical protein